MDELHREIAAEREHIADTLSALQEALRRKERTVVELAAMATFLQNTYNGMENLLKRILKPRRVSLPLSSSSHKDVLQLSVDNRIVSPELAEQLDEYRAFRHFSVHGYGIMLDEEKLIPLAEALPDTWGQLESELESFLKQHNAKEGGL